MLLIAENLNQLSFGSLMEVYYEGNLEKAREDFFDLPEYAGLRQAEQDFYQYLKECFFTVNGASYAIWVEQGRYVSALRWEPYEDGLLISALETAPGDRRKGYASKLLRECLRSLKKPVYSHVNKRNLASLAVHEKCGFNRFSDQARYLDGSVNSRAYTLRYLPENQ